MHKRNSDEEVNFEEDKQENLHKLEEIYKVERTSASSAISQKGVKSEMSNKKQNSHFGVIVVGSIIVVIVIILLYFYIKK